MTRVLIVDDELNIRSLLRAYLELEGFSVAEASNVNEAEAWLNRDTFQLVTLDITMPGESGLDFLGRIRSQYPLLAVLMVTIIDDMATAKTAIEYGAYGYVRKPVEREDLIIGVHTALRRREIEIARHSYQSELEFKVKGRTRELARSEERYRRLVEKMTEGLAAIDANRLLTYVNRRCCEMLGYAEKELLGRPMDDFVDESWRDHFRTQFDRRQYGGDDRYELIWRTKSDTRVHTIVSPAPLFDHNGNFLGGFGVITDITELKRAEKELLKQLTASTALADTAGGLVSEFNIEEISYKIITKAERLTNSEFGFIGYMNAADIHLFIPTFPSVKPTNGRLPETILPLAGSQGPWGWIMKHKTFFLKNTPLDDNQVLQELSIDLPIHRFLGLPALLGHRVIGLIGLCNAPHDYTEDDLKIVQPFADLYAMALDRTRNEEERKNREKNLREVLDSVSAGIMIIEADSRIITEVNPTAVQMLDAPKEDIIGRQCCDFSEYNDCENCPVVTPNTTMKNSEQILTNAKGEEIPVLKTTVPIHISGRPHFLQTFVDISDQKKMEFQLAQAQKLESIGQLASGIAHEINTPTQYVGDNTRFLREVFDDLMMLLDEYETAIRSIQAGIPFEEAIDRVEQAVEKYDLAYLKEDIPKSIEQTLEGVDRIAKIVQSMRQFAHTDLGQKAPTDLHKMIESTATVARNEYKYVADLELRFDSSLPLVPCYAGEFNQVILNLIVNAAHAIADKKETLGPEKGRIIISTTCLDEWVEIKVTDTGVGIPAAYQSRIFDPFFTTKEVGRGTGQGLTIAHSVIVEKHGGKIWFETEIGRGTTFLIHLPLKETEEIRNGSGKKTIHHLYR